MAKSDPVPAYLTCNARGQPLSIMANIISVLEHEPHFDLWYDEFAHHICIRQSAARPIRDDDAIVLASHLQTAWQMTGVTPSMMRDAILAVARRRPRHEVRMWLASLCWDGEPRLAMAFCDHWGAELSEYVCAASRNFFIGLVARVLDPGCKQDHVVVFEGPQGILKTSALELLAGQWYGAASASVKSKDFLECLRGKWLIEIGELDAFSHAETTRVKTIVSTRIDTYRPSYGHFPQDYKRQCVFVGTTNKDDWGADETGLRRFWPIRCGIINLKTLAAVRDQLFAEAVVRFRAGEHWWEMPANATRAEQAARQADDAWSNDVLTWANEQLVTGHSCVSVRDIAVTVLHIPIPDLDKSRQMRIARILTLAGWTRRTAYVSGQMAKVWYPPGPIS